MVMWMPQKLVRWIFPLVLIATPLTGYSGGAGATEAGPPCGRATPPAMEELLGGYVVRSAEKYRGGLTTPGQAEARSAARWR